MDKIYYSKDEGAELWQTADMDDAVQELANDLDEEELFIGAILTVYQGTATAPAASKLLPNIFELMLDNAFDNYGEAAENWSLSKEEETALQAHLESAADAWFELTNNQPKFGNIENIQPVEIRITKVDDYAVDWELVSRPA